MSDPIIFPEILDTRPLVFGPAGDQSHVHSHVYSNAPSTHSPSTYRLTAVLMHSGASIDSGHYTARILEQSLAARWLTVNDELVTKEDFASAAAAATKHKPPGVTQLDRQAPGGGRLFESCEAYLLTYTRVDVLDEAKAKHGEVQAPMAVREAVTMANATLRDAHERYQDALRALKARSA